MIKVLVVDDSALVRKLFGKVLANEADITVQFAHDGADALAQIGIFLPDVITLDVQMPGMNGLECLDRIMIERPCPVVMVASPTTDSADATLEALRRGAVDFVAKPTGPVSLQMEVFAPHFVATVRAATGAKLKASLRLRDRVRHRIGAVAARDRGTDAAAPDPPLYYPGTGLVLVGTSTGGPPALEALLKPLPAAFPWPIVVAQHMPASFTGPLARRLDQLCALTVTEVTVRVPLIPGSVYIGHGDADVVIARRRGTLVAECVAAEDYPWHPSTDRLVDSALAASSPAGLVGVLMTGMGDDGAKAMARLRAAGGRTIAESEETAVVWGMPGELARLGGADWIIPLPQIAPKLQQLVPLHAPAARH